jgi:radical SAM superfamily enzyme YgiQ (UPF0313 family)
MPQDPKTWDPALREPGSIVLVSCYELGHQPLSIAAPAAALRATGFAPRLLDLSKQALEPALFDAARLVAISVPMHTALVMGIRAARRVRLVRPSAHICLYGHYAGLHRDMLLQGVADSTLAGTSEFGLVELAQALEQGAPLQIKGLSTLAFLSPPRLDKPVRFVPDRSALLPLDSYVQLESDGGTRLVGYVETSQGCKHVCLHCPIPPVYGGRFVAVPRDRVLADIAQLVQLGARHITFGDPDFLNGPSHGLAIVRAAHTQFPDITYDFTAKVEHLLRHRELLPEFRRTGCRFIVTAVESLSDLVLANLRKGHNRADAVDAFRLAAEIGIPLRPSLLPFTPWSTLSDYLDLLDWIGESRLIGNVDPIQLAIRLLVPAGSALLGTPQFEPHRQDWDEAALSWRWVHPDPAMDALQREVMALVEAASTARAPAEQTFAAIREAACRAAGRPFMPHPAASAPTSVPRLTEPWFC